MFHQFLKSQDCSGRTHRPRVQPDDVAGASYLFGDRGIGAFVCEGRNSEVLFRTPAVVTLTSGGARAVTAMVGAVLPLEVAVSAADGSTVRRRLFHWPRLSSAETFAEL